jgi:hypothetical protein
MRVDLARDRGLHKAAVPCQHGGRGTVGQAGGAGDRAGRSRPGLILEAGLPAARARPPARHTHARQRVRQA